MLVHVATRVYRQWSDVQLPDLAAGLTYYGVLAVIPGLVSLVSLLGVLGQGAGAVETLVDVLARFLPSSALHLVEPVVEDLTRSSHAGWGLLVGGAGALWSVSRYVNAFGRALNRIYGVTEGRPGWILAPQMFLVTLATALLAVCGLGLQALSGSLARTLGEMLGIQPELVRLWNLGQTPALALIMVLLVTLLYYATPNVRQPHDKWLTVGAALAVAGLFVASSMFGLYLHGSAHYDLTYGSLAGGVVFLVWLWVTNVALLLGACLDAEVERARELLAGQQAEMIELPARDTRRSDKRQRQRQDDLRAERRIRESAQAPGDR